jgi:hypothetical protein
VQSVIKKLAIIFVSLAAVVFLIVAVSTMSANRSWRQHLAKLRAAGEPITFADIQALRPSVTTTGETVADVLTRIGEKVKASPVYAEDKGLDWPTQRGLDVFKGIRPDAVETARQYLAARLPVLEGIEQIQDLPPGRFAISYAGPGMSVVGRFFTGSPPVSRIAKIMSVDATLKLVDGDTKGAADTSIQLLKIASPTVDEPSLIAHMIRIRMSRKAARVLERVFRVGTLDDETLRRIDAEFARFLDSYTMKWGLWAVRAWYISMRDYFRSNGGIQAAVASVVAGDTPTRTTAGFGWLLDAQDDPVELLEAAIRFDTTFAKPRVGPMLTGMMAPAIYRPVVSHVRGLAKVRAARIAIAAERFRLTQGRLPETLDELVPEYLSQIPADPFDNSLMKLARTDAGIVIYSVGADEDDNGGSVDGTGPHDVGFRLLDVDQRGVTFIDPPPPEDE